MKIIGLSREGCWAMLLLSLLVLILADIFMYHSFAPMSETIPFVALIVLCLLRLLRGQSRQSKV
jgi:hypothetical protein